MQFITSKPEVSVTAEVLNTPRCPEGKSRVDEGLSILIRLVSAIQKPKGLGEEQLALRALHAIHEERIHEGSSQTLFQELDRCVRLVKEEEASHLISWLSEPPRWYQRIDPVEATRSDRLILIFTLLAQVFGRLNDYRIPRLVGDIIEQTRDGIDSHLEWLPRYWGTPDYFHTAALYLKITPLVLLDGRFPDPDSISPEVFQGWSWYRQAIHLEGWREIWIRHKNNCPAHVSTRIEFRLARARAFGPLKWRGGRLARQTLQKLGYRDFQKYQLLHSLRAFFMTALLFLACGLCWAGIHHSTKNLNSRSQEIGKQVHQLLYQEDNHE